jgi:LysM repeat protein
MRAPALVGIVAALHVGGLGLLVLMQGCGTTLDRRAKIESQNNVGSPPEPVFPPRRIASVETPVVNVQQTRKPVAPPRVEAGATYTLKQGQTLSHVAKHFGISSKALAEFNNIGNVDVVYVGQELKIPSSATNLDGGDLPGPTPSPSRSTPGVSAPTPAATVAGGGKYVVQSGDTISHIAKRYGLKTADIKTANALKTDRILVGQSLIIPVSGSPKATEIASATVAADGQAPETSTDGQTQVEPGPATSVSIPDIEFPAASGTGVEDVEAAEDPMGSTPEDTIPVSQEKPIVYNVLDGDTIDDIAKLFIVNKQELLKMNGLTGSEELKVDQEILIPQSVF